MSSSGSKNPKSKNLGKAFAIFMACAFSFPVWAADTVEGRYLYDRDGDIYTSNPDGSNETQLTHDGDSHTPKWSPDGQKILFIRNTSLQTIIYADGTAEELGQPTDFYIMDRNGSNSHRVKHLEGVVSDPSWSPDSKTIGFYFQSKEEWLHQGAPSFIGGFFELPSDGGEDRPRFISADARHIDWSPDSKKIVFSVGRPGNHIALHTANASGSDEAQLVDEETYIDSDSAKWSPDSNQIAFRSTIKRHMPENKTVYESAIFIVHPDGTHLHQLTYDLGWDCWHPWWGHNENKLTYSCYALPACQPANIKKHPDQCIGRTFTVVVSADDLHAKPVQISEQKGIAGSVIPEIAPK